MVPPPVVLIHGSTQSASCWELVRTHLEQAGHATSAVDLPADRPDASATDFAHIVVDQIRSVSGDCVVVAHSASGILLPRIAQLRPVAALVYLAAVIPVPGMSVMEQFAASPDMFDPEWVRAGPRWSDPANWRELADRFLFHDVLDSLREWAHSTVRPMRIETALREPLEAAEDGSVRSLCVPASRDRTINPEWQKRVWKERANGILGGASTGHAPHVASPLEVVSSILFASSPNDGTVPWGGSSKRRNTAARSLSRRSAIIRGSITTRSRTMHCRNAIESSAPSHLKIALTS